MFILGDIESEVKVKLWLKSEGKSERVQLMAKNTEGESKVLALFETNGKVYFPSGANMVGVTTDSNGRIGKNLNTDF